MLLAFMLIALSSPMQQPPVARPTPSAPPAATPPEAQSEDSRQICRRERLVGSNRPQRVCMTRREWNQQRDTSLQMMDRTSQGQGESLPRMGG